MIIPFLFDSDQMSVEAMVCFADQFAVEAPFAAPRFVSSNQENRFAPGIESEGHSPLAPSAALNRNSFILA
jgi:hypothetical protein